MKLHHLASVAAAAVALSMASSAKAITIDFDEFGPPDVTCCYADTTVLGPIIYASLTVQDGAASGQVMNGDLGWSSTQTSGDNLFGTLTGSMHFLFNADVFGVNFDLINGTSADDFTVTVFDASDLLIDTAVVGMGNYATSEGVQHVSFANTGVRRVEILGSDNFAVDTINFNGRAGPVPEPATWALMIGGFGLAGATLRRRRVLTAA
jgi:hypothetical protein